MALVGAEGMAVDNVDTTVVAQSVRVNPHRTAIRENLAEVLGVSLDRVSVKATTTDTMGFLGRDEGVVAMAVVALTEI